jgi:hypothetical protein
MRMVCSLSHEGSDRQSNDIKKKERKYTCNVTFNARSDISPVKLRMERLWLRSHGNPMCSRQWNKRQSEIASEHIRVFV